MYRYTQSIENKCFNELNEVLFYFFDAEYYFLAKKKAFLGN